MMKLVLGDPHFSVVSFKQVYLNKWETKINSSSANSTKYSGFTNSPACVRPTRKRYAQNKYILGVMLTNKTNPGNDQSCQPGGVTQQKSVVVRLSNI